MTLYVETDTPGKYGLVDTFINETVILNTKTIYVQDITAVFKGFTNDFSTQATPNNIKLYGYFGYTEQNAPANIKKRAKLFLNGLLYKEGIITIKSTSWVNGSPSLFDQEFSDGQRNLTEILGEDTFSVLDGGQIYWTTKNIQKGLQSIQTASDNVTRWFIPLVSTERIFSISGSTEAPATDNIVYQSGKLITSENVLLPQEIRPAVFISEILNAINKKYDIKIDPTPFIGTTTQLTDLATMCVSANVAVQDVRAKINLSNWSYDLFREERFDIFIRPLTPSTLGNVFELRYIGYGGGSSHDATFDMIIQLAKKNVANNAYFPDSANVIANYVYNLEVWEVDISGNKKKKLNYTIQSGAESRSSKLRIRIGLDVFTPAGGTEPSILVKPLIAVFASVDALAEWKFTNIGFNWNTENWVKTVNNNVQPLTALTPIDLFKSLPEMKLIDFVKSIYTMFAYKRFKDKTVNDFYYVKKIVDSREHRLIRNENDLTAYADLSKVTKKPNTFYDGYNLKHATSDYQQNVAFLIANGMEYGQLKYPLTGKPKNEFKIETKFTAPVFNPVNSDADTQIFTFYPFGSEAKLNDLETRFIYDTIVKELPVFYYNGFADISTPYAFVDTDSKTLKSIGKYHRISHRNKNIWTGDFNYITSLFNTLVGIDYVDQNTLYAMGYKGYIEDTLSGKRLAHTIDLQLPSTEIQKFDDSDEIIIKETKYTMMESSIGLTDGKVKLIMLNKV
jgi:hypothetical protein